METKPKEQRLPENIRRPEAEPLRKALQWRTVPPQKSSKTLETMWKKAAEKIGHAAKVLQDRSCRNCAIQGSAKLLFNHLPTVKQALVEAKADIEKAYTLPHVQTRDWPTPIPRPFALAYGHLNSAGFVFDEEGLADFLRAVQRSTALRMAEIWSLKAFLELVLVDRIASIAALADLTGDASQTEIGDENTNQLASLLKGLVGLSSLEWKSYFENVSLTENILRADPQHAYERMDSDTREVYRAAVAELASHSYRTEPEVAQAAISLAYVAQNNSCSIEHSQERRSHVGYYLVGSGQAALKGEIGSRASLAAMLREAVLKRPAIFFLLGIGVCTFGAIALLARLLHVIPLDPFAVMLFVVPALECALTTVNLLATRMFPPKRIPKLDFSKGIPGECTTIVAVPALLTNEKQVRQAARGLEVRYLANQDPNLHFALITDLPDSMEQFDSREKLAELCSQLLQDLDEKYAPANKGRFYHFHRNRVYNPVEGLWMGWERKRGKLLDFNRLVLNQDDQFPRKTGNISLLKNIRYVITLDLDTQLPRGAGQRLVGALAHPLNRAVIDPQKNIVVEGYGILQPRVNISVNSARRSRFASLLSGETGFDIYTRAVSDVYQDLFGEGIFTGKGIYEVKTFQKVLEHRFPCNAVLSHDLIEGIYARAGLVSDIEVVDDYPSHFSAFSCRKHRWVRGDWQIIFGLLPRVRNYFGEIVPNPLSLISRWKIFDNLRRSLTEFATMLLLIYGWMLAPRDAVRWALAAVAIMLFPTCFQLLLTTLTAGKAWFRRDFWASLWRDFASAFTRVFIRLAFLCHQSLMDVDAVVRTLVRMKFTHRKLLEWETAADAELENNGGKLGDAYLKLSLLIIIAVGPLVYLLHPDSLRVAMPFLVLWGGSAWLGEWLNRPQHSRRAWISASDRDMIRNAALRTWRFFREFSNSQENWLVPDFVEEASSRIAHSVSPTNLGLLLNARLAAVDLGYLTTQEFIRDTERTLETVNRMPKLGGHLYNWYSNKSLEPAPPLFVSTVDNGNLLGCLWTLSHGCREMIKQTWSFSTMKAGLRDHGLMLAEAMQQSCPDCQLVSAALDLQKKVEKLNSKATFQLEELRSLEMDALIFLNRVSKRTSNEEILWWAREFSVRVASLLEMLETFAPWLDSQVAQACNLTQAELLRLTRGLTWESIPKVCREIYQNIEIQIENPQTEAIQKRFRSALQCSIRLASETINCLNGIAAAAQAIGDRMDFSFLYDSKKKLFSIGYEQGEPSISKYNYDLLASEARTAVFVAIAKGEVPQEAWFQLKRAFRSYKGEDVLVSWSGTAFEYLMPCLWMRAYPDTLIEGAARAAIVAQQKFASEKGIPWGISECTCSKRNAEGHYMYHAFGLPHLAMHTDDCSGDVVVAPYATFLGLMCDVEGAVKNLEKMKELGWLASYGFYDAADFTTRRVSNAHGHDLVRNWMAHHQGMSLLAIVNVLCDSAMQRRFHAEPRVTAAERLLHEKFPHILTYEEDFAAMSESAPALALVTQQMPDLALRATVST